MLGISMVNFAGCLSKVENGRGARAARFANKGRGEMRNARTAVALAFAIAVALCASSANATFAGANGKIAFVRAGDIWTMNANGTGLTQVTTGGGAESPSWRPDGQKIAYVDAGGIELINADGTGKQPLLADAGVMGFGLSWSPNCSSIAYGHSDDPSDPTEHIWAVGVASGVPTQLTTGVTLDRSPDWSPDGSKIAFTSTRQDVAVPANGSTNYLLYAMKSDGTGVTRLTTLDDPSLHERNPSWKPDGTAIVIRSDTDFGEFPAGGSLVVVSANGVTRTPLTVGTDPLVGLSPAWSPDQAKIAVGAPSHGSVAASLFVYDVGSGTSTTPIEGDQPDWVASNGSCSGSSDTVAPTLTLPASVTVDATGPSGATVPFTATATDNIDPAPTVTCVPAALTLFPIGDTTVSCTARDASGNTAAGSFGVHVRGAPEQLTRLAARIVADPGITPRARTVLAFQILTVRNVLFRGVPTRIACLGLSGFIAEIRRLPSFAISPSSRAGVLADALRIRDVLAC